MIRAAILPERTVLRVSGEDARHFLQNLVTSDIEGLGAGEARFAALLTPQGKILFDFFVLAVAEEEGGGFLLDVPKALAAEFLKRLTFYKLRAKVELEPRPDLAVAVALEGNPPEEIGFAFADPRHPKLGTRIVLPAADVEAALGKAGFKIAGAEEWERLRISLGVPEGGKDFVYGDTFPHEANMDQLGGVDFAKGCFIGQEVVSRMQHKSVTRTRVVPVAYKDVTPLEGVEVKIGEKAAGFLGSAAGGRGLAKLRLDRVEDGLKAGESLSAGNIALTLVKPDWAKFPFPGEEA
jgi:folate-binding protein YgfZ